MNQQTVAEPFALSGITLRAGRPGRAEIRPAPEDAGIRFHVGAACIPAHVDHVVDTRLATTLGHAGATVSMVEHLCAALRGAGIDNAAVWVDGDEVPVLDGSAWPWLAAIRPRAQALPRRWIEVTHPIEVHDGEAWARLEPADGFELDIRVSFDHPLIGAQRYRGAGEGRSFADHLARARTFGFLADAERLRAAGLARGASLENTVVYADHGVLNPEGLSSPDEAVRHKALDAVGDAALLGGPLKGRLVAHRAGHTLHHALFRAFLAAQPLARAATAAGA